MELPASPAAALCSRPGHEPRRAAPAGAQLPTCRTQAHSETLEIVDNPRPRRTAWELFQARGSTGLSSDRAPEFLVFNGSRVMTIFTVLGNGDLS